MPETTIDGRPAEAPENPELRKLANEIAGCAILAIVRAVGVRAEMPDVAESPNKDAFEEVATALVADLSADQLERMKTAAQGVLGSAPGARATRFGHLSAINLGLDSSIGRQLETIPLERRLVRGQASGAAPTQPATRKAAARLLAAARSLAGAKPLPPPRRDGSNARFFPEPELAEPVIRTIDHASLNILLAQPALEVARATAAVGIQPGLGLHFEGVGPIETKYRQLNGPAGPLGAKDGGELFDEDHAGRRFRVQYYANGAIFLGPTNEAYAIWGPIFEHWQALAGVDQPHLGVPIMDQRRTPGLDGWFCHFLGGGSIYFTPPFGAKEVHGAIRAKWASLSWERGYLGFPKSDEQPSREPTPPGPIGAYSEFDGGSVYWSVRHGAHALPDPINDIYQGKFAELGNLGYPVWTSDLDGLRPVNFEGGRITVIDGAPQLRPMFQAVANRLRIVHAVKTTKEIGKDEIQLHWLGIDALGRKMTHKMELGQFGNSESKAPNFFFEHFRIDLNDDPHPWPRTYTSVFTLAEIDGSGFDNFLLQLVGAIEGGVNKALDIAATAASAVPVIGIVLQVVLGEILPEVLKKVWDFLKDGLNEDTVFEPVMLRFTLPSCVHYPVPLGVVDDWFMVGDPEINVHAQNGHYRLQVDWLIGPTDPA